MPTIRYRSKRRRENFITLTPNIRAALRHGRGFTQDPPIEVLQQAWDEYGDDLTEEWQREHPGEVTMPFAWWLFEAAPRHGERKIIDERGHTLRDHFERHGILHTRTEPPFQESEAEYIARHKLQTN